jgi:hypothetical protein
LYPGSLAAKVFWRSAISIGRSDFELHAFDLRSMQPWFVLEAVMSRKSVILVLVLGLMTTLLNLAMLAGQILTPATARAATSASKLLDNEDFTDGLTKIIRKTVRDYCTVGKRSAIDC